MATGFPVKANYATGDVLTAANMNDLSGTLNYLNGVPYNKNMAINGAFDIWQRGTSFANPANSSYVADRWCVYGISAATVSQETSVKPDTSTYSLKITATGSGSDNAIFQLIEQLNMEQFRGKQVTLSVKLAGTATLVPSFDFAYSTTANDNLVNTGTTISTTTIANPTINPSTFVTWAVTGTVPTTAKTLRIGLHSNSMANTNVLYIAEFQIELGSVNTPFTRAGGTIQGELAACQRYYYKAQSSTSYGWYGEGIGYNTTTAAISTTLPVTMRVAPTSVDYSTLTLYDGTNGFTVTACTIDTNQVAYNKGSANISAASGIVQYRPYYIRGNGSATAYIAYNAEL